MFAANGLLEDADFSWKLDEFDTIEVLMGSQLIPYVADYLSYAYSNGKGVTKNFKEVERLSSYASETIPEAKRYLAMELASVDFAKALKMIEEASGYLPAIEDYYFLLSDRLETYPDAKNKIKNMVPQLEALVIQATVFSNVFLEIYMPEALSLRLTKKEQFLGIRKPRHKMMRSQQIILPNTILV